MMAFRAARRAKGLRRETRLGILLAVLACGIGLGPARAAQLVVQVGAFSRPQGASSLAGELQGRGFQARTVAGGDYYRVVIGPFASETQAQAGLSKLQQEGYQGYLRRDLVVEPGGPAAPLPRRGLPRAPQMPPQLPPQLPRQRPTPVEPSPAPPSPVAPAEPAVAPQAELTAPPPEPPPVERASEDLFVVAPEEPPTPLPIPAMEPPRIEAEPVEPAAPELKSTEPVLLSLALPPPPPPEPAVPPAPVPAAAPAPPIESRAGLQILILAGEDAINNVKRRTAQDPVVQVVDENNRPVAGAVLMFTLPSRGASGSFANGARSMTVVSDSRGTATATGLTPNGVEGQMPIQVMVSYQGQTASATIRQLNFRESGGVSGGAKVAIVGAIAAGAAVGLVKALDRNEDPNAGRIRATATVGSPSVGQP